MRGNITCITCIQQGKCFRNGKVIVTEKVEFLDSPEVMNVYSVKVTLEYRFKEHTTVKVH